MPTDNKYPEDMEYGLKDMLFSEHMKDVMPDTLEAMKDMASYVVPTSKEELALEVAAGPVGKVVGKLPLPKSSKQLKKLFEQLQEAMKKHYNTKGPNSVFPQAQQVDEVFQALRTAEVDDFVGARKPQWDKMRFDELVAQEGPLFDEATKAGFVPSQIGRIREQLTDAKMQAFNDGRVRLEPVYKHKGTGETLQEIPIGTRVTLVEPIPGASLDGPWHSEGKVVGSRLFKDFDPQTGEDLFYRQPILELPDGSKAGFHPSHFKDVFLKPKAVK